MYVHKFNRSGARDIIIEGIILYRVLLEGALDHQILDFVHTIQKGRFHSPVGLQEHPSTLTTLTLKEQTI